jgi:histidinol-phosphatase (PHP family)
MNKKIDLHNHTYLCNHANGTVNEYIEQAIDKKIDIYGFAEHAPFKSGFDPDYRLSFEQINIYFELIKKAKIKYKNKIEILTGFEVDFLQNDISEKIINLDVDYLIGSVHFLNKWGFDNPEFIGRYQHENIDQLWKNYFLEIEKLAESNLFQIVGHIDLLKVFKFLPKNRKLEDLAENSLKKIKKHNLVIEINGSGFRKPISEQYPSEAILKMAYDMKINITFSSDAHSVDQVGKYHDQIEKLAKKIGFSKVAVFRNKELDLVKF